MSVLERKLAFEANRISLSSQSLIAGFVRWSQEGDGEMQFISVQKL